MPSAFDSYVMICSEKATKKLYPEKIIMRGNGLDFLTREITD